MDSENVAPAIMATKLMANVQSKPTRKYSLPTPQEMGELAAIADNEASSSSSSSPSPNGKETENCIIPAGLDPQTGRQYGLDCNYLLKQMNRRKLHLPCPICQSLVVNMSDHLAKTHLIMDFKQRKYLLNMVRNEFIMNPNGLKHLINNNSFLIGEMKVVEDSAVKVEPAQQQPPQPQALNVIPNIDQALKDLIRRASLNASASQLTPDPSDVDRYSEESETNNSKFDFFFFFCC
jgi:hypothetical protein